MRFIYPNFLWALLLIAVPIIIHLVNLRRHQTVYFSNVNFLKLVRKETKRKSKIKQLLILSSRILMMIALILAFAKPYLSTKEIQNKRADNAIGIYIDNSFSMNAEGPEGKAIESAKQKAFAIVNAAEPDTKFALLTNELSEKQNRFYSQTEVKQLISNVVENHQWVQLSTIVLRFKDMMENFLLDTEKSIFLISDLQKFSFDLDNLQPDSVIAYNIVPVPINSFSNLYIDSCWYDAPTHHSNQLEILNVRLVNRSKEDYRQIPVNFYINDSLKTLASADINANEEKTIVLQYTNPSEGTLKGRVEITDYPIIHDNTMYLAYHIKSELKVLLINEDDNATLAKEHFQALFSDDEFITLDTKRADRIQISNLANYSAIFMNEVKTISTGLGVELQKYITNGGTLVIIPPVNCNIPDYNNFFSMLNISNIASLDTTKIPINEVIYDHPLYKEVFKDNAEKVVLPSMNYRYRFTENQLTSQTKILTFADKTNALTEANIGAGTIYTFSFPLSHKKNDFINHILFLPTFYNIALQSTIAQNLYAVMGIDSYFEWNNLEQIKPQNLVLKHLQSGMEYIPKMLPHAENTLKFKIETEFDAGFYSLISDKQEIGVMAYNYQLNESDLTYYNSDEISKIVKQKGISQFNLIDAKNENFETAIAKLDNGKQFWKIFILIAFLFLLIEAAIIKFWP